MASEAGGDVNLDNGRASQLPVISPVRRRNGGKYHLWYNNTYQFEMPNFAQFRYRLFRAPIAQSTAQAAPMPVLRRHPAVVLALALLAGGLGGCGTINEKLAGGMGDYIPQWLGGLPADAPPRPGTAQYDEFMREREKKRLEPAAATKEEASQISSAAPSPVR